MFVEMLRVLSDEIHNLEVLETIAREVIANESLELEIVMSHLMREVPW